MEPWVAHRASFKWRRIAALLAMLGLMFAGTVASVTHSLAMPLMGTIGISIDHSHRAMPTNASSYDYHQSDSYSHHHAEDVLADQPQNPDEGSCGEGCLLCKDCSLCSYLNIEQPQVGGAANRGAFEAARFIPLLDTSLPTAIEPPRV